MADGPDLLAGNDDLARFVPTGWYWLRWYGKSAADIPGNGDPAENGTVEL